MEIIVTVVWILFSLLILACSGILIFSILYILFLIVMGRDI